MHKATQRFWERLESLPVSIQALAHKNFALLKADPQHPSLHFKKVGHFWSAQIGLHYRALAVKADEDFVWVWIDTHDEYDRMIK